MSETHYRACPLCEAICGLIIETEGGKIASIKGDPRDPLSRGHICPKAVALKDIHEDPDRLRYPVKRVTGENGRETWREIGWDEALDTTAEALLRAYREHGVDAIGVYLGNPSVHNYGMLTHQNHLFRWLRTRNRYSATSVDQFPHHLSALWLFGHKSLFPIPDIDRSAYFLMLGANPLASNGSIWTVPGVKKRIRNLQARGGKLLLVDPRRTETARLADEHLPIVPGSDALFLAAVLHTLFAEALADPGRLAPFTTGLGEVAAALTGFTAELAEAHTGIPARDIRRIAREFAAADAAICYARMGVSTQRFGALCQWLIQLINIATGNLDREGAACLPCPPWIRCRARAAAVSIAIARGCAACPSSTANCRRRPWPRKLPRPARVRFAFCLPEPAIPCSLHPTDGPWTRRCRGSILWSRWTPTSTRRRATRASSCPPHRPWNTITTTSPSTSTPCAIRPATTRRCSSPRRTSFTTGRSSRRWGSG